jgi:hypothetical protein
MLSRTTSIPVVTAVVASMGAAFAQPNDWRVAPANTLTITLDGTLGPILSGSDPAGLDGESATVTVAASEALKPYKSTAHSASYHIPAGDVTVNVNGTNYTSATRSKMIVRLSGKADLLTLKATLHIDGFAVNVSDVTSLAAGSWTNSILEHPGPFSPSPQNLVEPSSNFTYSVFGETTVLGVTGTASNSDASDRAPAEDNLEK